MNLIEYLDPELAAALQTFPAEGFLHLHDIAATRVMLTQMLGQLYPT